ncbi:DNA mismatch repair endonuclease MutH [Legionella israelensis]|uniref:DNA mismatch repair endonuclease MutH n=1 Tax=Legionella israelensis TaxID=454 RepID=UPI00117D0703|nr:DNA mismatch repair endonuclease MutH [Legionella israelensis]QDP73645.1 DNA mismatch repair endonuclease MutH [Legionella israelensis]
MKMAFVKNPPKNERELIDNYQQIAGLTFFQLAEQLGLDFPALPSQRKGWVGQAIELALGTTASNHSLPDFHHLGIELKTLPLGSNGKPTESTFITTIPLLTIHQQNWSASQCFAKLKRVLWLPVEGDTEIPFVHRRIGLGFLWSPTLQQTQILEADWTYLTNMICMGQLEEIDARHGEYLQIRPKAANAKSLSYSFDSTGKKIKTLPRGFYLRSSFTAEILTSALI